MVEHPIFGKDIRKIEIKSEDDCSKCEHEKVCKRDMSIFCKNYEFGTSEFKLETCGSCLLRFTRFDKQKIPCFACNYFKPKE